MDRLESWQLDNLKKWRKSKSEIENFALTFTISMYLTFFLFDATNEWITAKANDTATNWIVVDDLATCILATRAWTWIFAFLIDARHVLGAFGTNHTLRATIWRSADVVRQTRAHSVLIQFTALTIQTARRWLAGIDDWWILSN